MSAIYLRCPECRARFKFPQFLPGRKVKCPECGVVFTLNEDHAELPPAYADATEDGWSARLADPQDGEALGTARAPARPAGRGGVFLGVLVGCGLLVLLIAGVVGAVFWWMSMPMRFPPQTEDYALARSHFRTRLIRAVPSFQPPRDPRMRPPPEVEEVTYPSGRWRLKAWLKVPADKEKHPAVVYVHSGFAFDMDDWRQTEPFRDAGFAVMTPTLRGENGQRGQFTFLYDELDDVLAAGEFLAGTRGVDPDRVYVAGHCEGGTLALLAAMTSKRFRKAASVSGAADATVWVRNVLREEPADVLPFNFHDSREIQMRSPLAFPRSFKCPVRLYYGEIEAFPSLASGCRKLAELAQQDGLDVEAVPVPGHFMSMVKPAIQECIPFFQER